MNEHHTIEPFSGSSSCGFHTAGDVPTQKPARHLNSGSARQQPEARTAWLQGKGRGPQPVVIKRPCGVA